MINLENDIIESEKRTVSKMIKIFCRGKHAGKDKLCLDCQELLDYSWQRLDLCRYAQNKTTCGKCPIHCYKPLMRKRIKEVMRYAGPRMIIYHPLEALKHFLQSCKTFQR